MAALDLTSITDEAKARFWATIDKRTPLECWLWTSTVNRDGYARVAVNGLAYPATHLALVLDGRPRPYAKAKACHRCDNPTCLNPDHLWWGTHRENAQDAARKGRWSRPLGNRITRHHINLMNCPDERLPREALGRRVSVEFLTALREKLRKRRPRIGDPLDGLPHPNQEVTL